MGGPRGGMVLLNWGPNHSQQAISSGKLVKVTIWDPKIGFVG